MVWRPKEKELTPEEAINLAKKELAQFWLNSSPLVAGVKINNNFILLPLDPEFQKKNWLTILIDPTYYSSEMALTYAKEWHRRYSAFDLNIIILLNPAYKFYKIPDFFQEYVGKKDLKCIWVIDGEETLIPSFGNPNFPKVALFHKGKIAFQYEKEDWTSHVESEIQKFLRNTDPGLPLFPPYQGKARIFHDKRNYEFGMHSKSGKSDEITIGGRWTQEEERIITDDSTAFISFTTQCSRIGIVAQSLMKVPDRSKIMVEINGVPANHSICGENLVLEESGETSVLLWKPQVYDILNNLPLNKSHQIVFRFSNSSVAPLAIYGIRIAE